MTTRLLLGVLRPQSGWRALRGRPSVRPLVLLPVEVDGGAFSTSSSSSSSSTAQQQQHPRRGMMTTARGGGAGKGAGATGGTSPSRPGRRKMRPLPPLPSASSSNKKKEAAGSQSQDVLVYEEEDTEEWAAFMEEYDALEAQEEEEAAARLASVGSEGPLVVEEYRVEEDAEGGMRMVQTNKDKQAKQQKDGKDSVKALLREARENGAMTEDDWFEFLRRAGIERAGGDHEQQGAFSEEGEEGGKNSKGPPPPTAWAANTQRPAQIRGSDLCGRLGGQGREGLHLF